jgi:quinol monooxygenase YgiN
MLVIAGTVKVKPETRSEAVQAALKMAKASQAEAGCRSYAFYADLEDPNTILIFERWDNEAALMAHFQTPHMAEFNAAIPRFLAAPPTIMRYDVAAETKLI